ncbi:hypothetical protein V6N13_072586 [Hibiscus sabdariffa]
MKVEGGQDSVKRRDIDECSVMMDGVEGVKIWLFFQESEFFRGRLVALGSVGAAGTAGRDRGCRRGRVAGKLASGTMGTASRGLAIWNQQQYWAVWPLPGPEITI